jgi:hypothetical protein
MVVPRPTEKRLWRLERGVVAGARVLLLQGVIETDRRGVDDVPVAHLGAEHAGKIERLRRGVGERAAADDLEHLLQRFAEPGVEGATHHLLRPRLKVELHRVGLPAAVARRGRDDHRSEEHQGPQATPSGRCP